MSCGVFQWIVEAFILILLLTNFFLLFEDVRLQGAVLSAVRNGSVGVCWDGSSVHYGPAVHSLPRLSFLFNNSYDNKTCEVVCK